MNEIGLIAMPNGGSYLPYITNITNITSPYFEHPKFFTFPSTSFASTSAATTRTRTTTATTTTPTTPTTRTTTMVVSHHSVIGFDSAIDGIIAVDGMSGGGGGISISSTTPMSTYNDDDYLNALTDEEYIDFVANFLKPTFIEMIFAVIFLCLMIVGITGNCLVVYVVSRNKSMNASVYVSVFTLMCIAVERWKAISNPLAIPFWRTHHIIVVIWIISCVLSLPEPLTLEIYPADYTRKNLSTTWGTRCMESWSMEFQQKYQLTQTIMLFITPLLIISGFCIHMTLILRKKALQISSRQLRDRQRATKMLIVVVLVFAISYLPVHLHNIATAFHIEPESEPSLIMIALRKFIPRFTSYSSSCLNPILYNFMSEKFRKEFRRACCFNAGLVPSKERFFYNSGALVSRERFSSNSRLNYGGTGTSVFEKENSTFILNTGSTQTTIVSKGSNGGKEKRLIRFCNSENSTNFLF